MDATSTEDISSAGPTYRFVVLAVILWLVTIAASPKPTAIPADAIRAESAVEAYLPELDDALARFDIADVSHQPLESRFAVRPSRSGDHVSRCRWYRIVLDPALEASGPWVFFAQIKSAQLFEPTRFGYHLEMFGTDTLDSVRRIHNGLPNVDIRHEDYGKVLFVRLDGPPVGRLTLRSVASVTREAHYTDLTGIFFGTIFAVLMVAAIVFAIITRTKAFAYYGVYMATQALNQLNNDPFVTQWMWPQIAPIPWLIAILYLSLSPLSFTYFFRYALATRKSPIFDRLLIALGFGSAFAGVTCFGIDDYYGSEYVTSTLPLLYAATLLFVLSIAMVRWRQRYVSAGIYVVGIFGVIFGFASSPWLSRYLDIADFGFAWEAMAFLAAMAYRLAVITKDREAALAETLVAKEAVSREFALRIETVEELNRSFARFVPHEFLVQLGRDDVRAVELGDHVEREMTVLFCDIRSFVAMSESSTPAQTFEFLNQYFGRVGPIVRAHNGFIDKYLGDGIMAIFPGSADDAMQAAIALQGEVRRFNESRAREGDRSIEVGIGLHRGRLMLATIGEHERYDTTVIADVVNIAARLEGLTKVYGAAILASNAVVASVSDAQAYNVRWLGEIQVVGSSKPVSAYEVFDGDAAALMLHKRETGSAFARGIAAYRSGRFGTGTEIFDGILEREPHDVVARYFAERSHRRLTAGDVPWDGVERHTVKS